MLYPHKKYIDFLFLFILFTFVCCKKFVQVPEPVNTITTSEAFSNNSDATSAVLGLYNDLISYGGGSGYANGATTLLTGLSSDEFNYFYGSNTSYIQLQVNTILPNNGLLNNSFWAPAYYDIYLANAIIEGLSASKGVDTVTKKQLIGEAKFFRAFCHFYLANLFGDVPLITSSAWTSTDTLRRTPSTQIYQQIISDLKDAQSLLTSDYSVGNGERIRVNKWASIAMLARVYLYTGDWIDAESQANLVIGNTNLFNLVSDLNAVFLANSSETILQLQINSGVYPYTTQEARQLIPSSSTTNPNYYLTGQLLSSFEAGDQRKISWIDSTIYSGVTYYFPYKYKVRDGTQGSVSEYYMVLRLAEQYLIRAEARVQQNKLADAIADLNIVRERAGLQDLQNTLVRSQVLAAVAQERRIELFAEWGHRWFDLKRTAQSHNILSAISYKQPWLGDYQLLYPIPLYELQTDPNLTQNPGY